MDIQVYPSSQVYIYVQLQIDISVYNKPKTSKQGFISSKTMLPYNATCLYECVMLVFLQMHHSISRLEQILFDTEFMSYRSYPLVVQQSRPYLRESILLRFRSLRCCHFLIVKCFVMRMSRAPSFYPTCFRPTFFIQSISSNLIRLGQIRLG